MASRTRAAVAAVTRSGALSTRETVIGATPAAAATSVILTEMDGPRRLATQASPGPGQA